MQDIPSTVGQLKSLVILNADRNQLTAIPPEVSICTFVRPPGTIVWEGLMFYCSLFFSLRDLRGPWFDLREILPHRQKHVQFTNAHAKFGLILNPFPL